MCLIYWYDTGIWCFFDSFWSGMVLVCEKWYGCHFDSLDGPCLVHLRTGVHQPGAPAARASRNTKARSARVQLVAHPGPSLPTTHPGGAVSGLGTHRSAGGGWWQRHLVAGVVGGGGVRGRHGHHHGHPHPRRQDTTTINEAVPMCCPLT